MVSVITESQMKLQNWPKKNKKRIYCSMGVPLHKHSCLPPKQCNANNLLLTSKCRAEQFPNDFTASGDMLYFKFFKHTVNWKCVDMCKDHVWANMHLKNKENTVLHTLSNGRVTGKKNRKNN